MLVRRTSCRTSKPRLRARPSSRRLERRGCLAAPDRARVDELALARERLEEHLILRNLDQHERVVGVEAFFGDPRLLGDVALSELGRAAGSEVGDALLWLQAF